MKIIVKTLAGLEEVLAKEIRELGGQEVEILRRAVEFEGDKTLLYRANLCLRTAVRILVPIRSFVAQHDKELYRKVLQVDWSKYMGPDDTLAVDATTHSDFFTHSKFAALRVKDAVVDQFRNNFGRRPNVDLEEPNLRINLHIQDNRCSLALDSSGSSLHLRGYRAASVEAPINEVLAAGMILLSGWKGEGHFIDPMCGSGTIPIEAALYARRIPPNLRRRYFGFKKWNDFDRKLWEEIIEEEKDKIREFPFQIMGSDKNFKAIKAAQENAFGAYLDGKISFERIPFEKFSPPPAEPGSILITNPPYDERLADADIEGLYKTIGDTFKQKYAGYNAWMISSNRDAIKRIGLRHSKKIMLYNGALECRFVGFELYEGSKKGSKDETHESHP